MLLVHGRHLVTCMALVSFIQVCPLHRHDFDFHVYHFHGEFALEITMQEVTLRLKLASHLQNIVHKIFKLVLISASGLYQVIPCLIITCEFCMSLPIILLILILSHILIVTNRGNFISLSLNVSLILVQFISNVSHR